MIWLQIGKKELLGSDGSVLKPTVLTFAKPYRLMKHPHVLHLKWVNFIVGKSYLNKAV